jgi:peptidoglycan/LPS O-acetylase OafA/YrhL
LRAAAACAMTILVAAISYPFLETPFLNLKRRFTYVASRPV